MKFSSWISDARGGIATTFALALPVVFGALGLATDYGMMMKVRGDLQAAADAAALAGAREVPLARKNTAQVLGAVKSFAAYSILGDAGATGGELKASNITLAASVEDDFSAVRVDLSEAWTPFFVHFLSDQVTPIRVTSKARFIGSNNICVLGLASKNASVTLGADARLTGNNCGVFSNSASGNGFTAESGARLTAAIVCSSGGTSVSGSAVITPAPVTDCPVTDDPLASRKAPPFGSCDQNGLVLTSVNRTLNPGVYCGGLKIDGTSSITLNPGVYVIKDGSLIVNGRATIKGKGVGFFITGAASATTFGLQTHIALEAPTSGPLAGLLIFEDRTVGGLNHRISSDDARTLVGTIYLPRSNLTVDAKQPVADQSAYTAIVVKSLQLSSGPNLVLNSDYEGTNVPVPHGIAGTSQVVLSD